MGYTICIEPSKRRGKGNKLFLINYKADTIFQRYSLFFRFIIFLSG